MPIQVGLLPDDIIHTILDGNTAQCVNNGSFIRLPHPRTGLPTLFLPHQTPSNSTISELQAVDPTNSRSWFIGNEVVSDGRLLLIMPVDPAFILVPMLRSFSPKNGSLGQFRTADDIFEEVGTKLEQSSSKNSAEVILAKDVATFTSLDCCRDALTRVCDIQELPGDIIVHRFSPTKYIGYLKVKVENLLKADVIEGSRTLVRSLAKDGLMEDGNEKLYQAGRLKIACDLVTQYLPPDLRMMLVASYDFSALDVYLEKLEEEKRLKAQEASNTTKARKKAVKEESKEKVDKRKASKASQGVEKLKKANINGMAKLSTFFTKNT
ncbi:ribonuclease H2, subunit B [Lentinula aciculospora]|uniref:Ribonuclease H2 subunit B n=1 Tax=Lentinula aciculospora TaxID=153920 RepID=A0A9W9AHY8_9AGAR|nr:ribonuclease H2, subunit B [Lentinula aciculospora]